MEAVTESLLELVSFALDHGIESVRGGHGPLVPFLISEVGERRSLERFVDHTLEASLARAETAAEVLPRSVSAYVIAHDGFVTIEGKRFDAILVEAAERSRAKGLLFAQRYRPKKLFLKLKPIGDPALIGEAPNRLEGAV